VVRPHEAAEVERICKTLHQERLAGQLERLHPVAEERSNVILAPPQQRRQRVRWRRWRVAVDDLEQVARQAGGDECSHSDRPAGTAHPHELIGHRLMARGEDRAGRGGDDVEHAVVERERLGVRLHPLEPHSVGEGLMASRSEVLRGEIGRDDLCAPLGRADRHVAGAGRDVEHALTGVDAARLDELAPERPKQVGRDAVIVAERPELALACLQVRGCPQGCRDRHLLLSSSGEYELSSCSAGAGSEWTGRSSRSTCNEGQQ
jgi:hypothetical protein